MASPPSLAEFALAQCRTSLRRYLRHRLKNSQLTEDLAQEVFLRLLTVKHPELVRIPKAYLFQVASHLIYEVLTSERRNIVTFSSHAADSAAGRISDTGAAEPSNCLEAQQQVSMLLERLPPVHAAMLVMKKRDGKSVKDIAVELGYSEHTVKKYLAQALALCRMEMKRRAHD